MKIKGKRENILENEEFTVSVNDDELRIIRYGLEHFFNDRQVDIESRITAGMMLRKMTRISEEIMSGRATEVEA